MKIYLAGENQKKHIIPMVHSMAEGGGGRNLEIFLAEGESRHWLHDLIKGKEEGEDLKIYLAGVAPWRESGLYDDAITTYKPYILESFYYANEDTERLLPYFGDFLLDSGAFTFMQGNGKDKKWENYIEGYANFILRNNVKKYFELDIDSVVGYDKVKEYRKLLESLVGRPCIPVWHKSRGMKEFSKMCDEYEYAAIGGIVSGEIKKDQYAAFPPMIKEAHRLGCKLHGLGFTSLDHLQRCHFDSVDSTAWTSGNRFGFVYQFDGKTMVKHDVPAGKRLADGRKIALINYIEWIKFQKYAETHL